MYLVAVQSTAVVAAAVAAAVVVDMSEFLLLFVGIVPPLVCKSVRVR